MSNSNDEKTRQPLFNFGSKFTKEVCVEYEGTKQKAVVNHVVAEVIAVSTESGHEYFYRLSNSFPSAYSAPSFFTDLIGERDLQKIYKGVPNE